MPVQVQSHQHTYTKTLHAHISIHLHLAHPHPRTLDQLTLRNSQKLRCMRACCCHACMHVCHEHTHTHTHTHAPAVGNWATWFPSSTCTLNSLSVFSMCVQAGMQNFPHARELPLFLQNKHSQLASKNDTLKTPTQTEPPQNSAPAKPWEVRLPLISTTSIKTALVDASLCNPS